MGTKRFVAGQPAIHAQRRHLRIFVPTRRDSCRRTTITAPPARTRSETTADG